VLESIHVAGRSILPFNPAVRLFHVAGWQASGKAEKFYCVFVGLPNERNQAVSYFLRVFRVTGQILVQKPLLIKQPPY
jgi:hypothetical protein